MKEALEKSNLKQINIDNLQQGKDSDGNDMPRYRNPEYANDKTKINPNNRGFWDLRLTGEYYRGIDVRIFGSKVFFTQKFRNEKIDWLHERLLWQGHNLALGITENQFFEVQMKNKPKIKQRLENIINGTT